MNNLFICHTQANLSLASGLALGRFHDDTNDLVLYRDFSLSDMMRERLSRVFKECIILQGVYPKELNTYRAKLLYYPKGLKLIRSGLHKSYDHVFLVCDTVLLTQIIMKSVWRNNKEVTFSWLEDGIIAYYQDTNEKHGLDRNSITRFFRSLLFKYFCGVGHFYERDFQGMGGSSCISDSYVLLPNLVREPYRTIRPLVEITKEEFITGLKSLYPVTPITLDERSIILVLDLLSRYKYPSIVRENLGRYISKWKSDGYTVYCKFHPREEQVWEIFDTCVFLDRRIGIESLYLSLIEYHDSILVVGIKSTSLVYAKLLGFEALSLFPITLEENANLVSFYKALDINISR